ncbi:MAG TPA: hypothetical protein VFP65_09750 [Anaeromyxobacteraceae bacterium]|nr:hypothetical protein [Anaeromyxobacteraceae bacterium]
MTLSFRSITAPLALALVAACSSSGTKLSMSARSGTATAAAAAPGRTTRLAAGGGVNLTRVRMVIEEIKLESAADGGSGGSSDGGSDGGVQGEDTILGPYLLDMSGAALDSGLTQVFDADAVPGTYKEIRFKIHKLSGGDPQFPDMEGLSIRLEGTDSSGKAFIWTSSLDEEQRHEGTFVIADGSSNNITLAIDTSGWFVDGNGRPIDPTAAQNGSLQSTVESNIKNSIDAFDDDNHDGRHD